MFREDATDREIARRLKTGDTTAMADLYDRFGTLVYAIALRMVRNPSTAEDLVQETFIRIWGSIQLFDEERGALGSWVAAVARNRIVDHLRSLDWRMMRTLCELNSMDQRIAEEPPHEDQALQSPELTKAVTSLTENHRRVLELAYLEGLSQTEIAVRIQKPVGTVKTWSRSALKTLRAQIMRTNAGGRISSAS